MEGEMTKSKENADETAMLTHQDVEGSEIDFAKNPLKDKIGSSLKRLYDDVVNEPVPDEFLSLLAKADEK